MGEGAPRRVSVVMATYRREELLRAALEDVLALKYPELEIIVVDQTPEHTPATRALLASVADHVRLIHQARPHVVTALNAGLAAARGEIVLFLDDDIRITDPDFVTPIELPVGTKTRWRSESVAMTDHALAAPLRHPFGEVSEFSGMGSQLQRNAPERMSNARTTPVGSSTRPLSLIDDPTITRSSIRTGGEVM